MPRRRNQSGITQTKTKPPLGIAKGGFSVRIKGAGIRLRKKRRDDERAYDDNAKGDSIPTERFKIVLFNEVH